MAEETGVTRMTSGFYWQKEQVRYTDYEGR